MDYEKLGVFYLGRQIDPATNIRAETPLLYDSSDLVTHGVIVGMTGSGKTGLGIDLIEEAAIDGVPVIAIDPKGDLGNLLLSADDYGAEEAARWTKGLAEWGQDASRIARLREAAEFALYTPGMKSGRPVSIIQSFAAPPAAILDDSDLLSDRLTTATTSVLTLAGVDADSRGREHVLVSTLFSEAWKNGRGLDLASLIAQVQAPPITRVGVLDLESFYPSKDRFQLAMQLNQLLASPGFSAWLEGEPLNIDRLLFSETGKPRVSVITIAHLDDQERMFFVSLLLNEIVTWMRAQRGTSSLRAMIYFDEIFGFLPPVANPPTKAPLLKLLKQARAFGLGIVVATQNPVDLDYKALANAGTWMLGRLQTERDKARVLDGLEGAAQTAGLGFERAQIDRMLSALGKRIFLMHNVHEKDPILFETRWTLSYLRGPLGRDEIKALTANRPSTSVPKVPDVPIVPKAGASAQAPTPVRGTAGTFGTTVLDPSIPQFFAPGGATVLVPMLLGAARIAYSDAKLGLDETREVVVLTPITDEAVPVDWERAEPASFGTKDLSKAPAQSNLELGQVPAAGAKAKNYPTWEKEFGKWAAGSQSIELFRSPSTKTLSKPDESERDFRIRMNTEAREARDAEKARITAKYASKITTLDDRIRKAEQAVQVQSEQATGAKLQTAVSVGAAIFGALLSRKVVSATNIGRVTTAARGAGRIGKESQDISRAETNVSAIREQRDTLHAELEAELQQVSEQFDASNETLERVLVKPKRGGVSVQLVALVWVPQ
jgi:hypothetical protein